MSQPDRETVYEALFTILNNVLGPTGTSPLFAFASRRISGVEAMASANMPAMYQSQRNEAYKAIKGLPQVRRFRADLILYANFGADDTAIPSSSLNGLVTAVENVMGPNMATAFQQLGVPVSSAMIDGNIEYHEGVLNVFAVAVVPIEIIANY